MRKEGATATQINSFDGYIHVFARDIFAIIDSKKKGYNVTTKRRFGRVHDPSDRILVVRRKDELNPRFSKHRVASPSSPTSFSISRLLSSRIIRRENISHLFLYYATSVRPSTQVPKLTCNRFRRGNARHLNYNSIIILYHHNNVIINGIPRQPCKNPLPL
jgi:hypothetical protein